MTLRGISIWLRGMIVVCALLCALFCLVLIRDSGPAVAREFPEYAFLYPPMAACVGAALIPVFAALAIGWRICVELGEDRFFSEGNAARFSWIGRLALGEMAFCLIALAVAMARSHVHPGLLLAAIGLVFVGTTVALIALVLSRHIAKAVELQKDQALTI